MCKIQEDNDLLNHVNNVRILANQFGFLNVHVGYKDNVKTMLKSLTTLHKYLITIMEMMAMNELTMNYIMTHLRTTLLCER